MGNEGQNTTLPLQGLNLTFGTKWESNTKQGNLTESGLLSITRITKLQKHWALYLFVCKPECILVCLHTVCCIMIYTELSVCSAF